METKKYTTNTHPTFWGSIVLFILWTTSLLLSIIWKSSVALSIIFSINSVYHLVMAIRCRLAWNAFVEISDEGVKMKGCAKRISGNKKKIIDDIFIPWENIEEIDVWYELGDGTFLTLNTGEKIKLTQQIDVDGKDLRKAIEQYKPKQTKQTQENPIEVVGVIGLASDNTSSNEFTTTE